jgi:putative peptidoglycan lipid II flippase
VYLILGTGQFGWPEIRLTAASLGIFSFGIFAFCLIPLLAKVFFSFQNTKIPVTIGVASIGLSIALSFLFVWLLGFSNAFQEFLINFLKLQGIRNIQIIGLPLALSLSGIFNFSLLFIFLHREIQKKLPQARKLLKEKIKETLSSLRKILIAGCFLIILTYYLLQQIAFFVNVQTFSGVFLQTSIAAFSGIFVYILTTFLLGSPELTVIKTSILKQFTKTS